MSYTFYGTLLLSFVAAMCFLALTVRANRKTIKYGEELKPCPFCAGEVELHEDDYGGAWVEHKVKHKDGKEDPCILTTNQIRYYSTHAMTWNTRRFK